MTQVTGDSPSLSAGQAAEQAAAPAAGRDEGKTGRRNGGRAADGSATHGRLAVLVLTLLRGVLAAGLGLGALIVVVMVLWISSSTPDDGLAGALHTAAGIWLLAHGAELIRTDTLSGAPAPIGLVPLLLAVMPVWLVHRAARDALEAEEERAAPSAVAAFTLVTGGYLLVGVVVALYALSGSPSVRVPMLALPSAVVAGAAAAGAWTACGRPVGPPPSWAPVRVHEALARSRFRERAATACRSAVAGVVALLGGGAFLVAVSLVWHAQSAQHSFVELSGDWTGRIPVLLLALVLVPNAAVWGAAYGLGPGFALGTTSVVTPLAFTGHPARPVFPLLAAVPDHGTGTALNWAAAAVPVAAGLTVAWFTVWRAAPAGAGRERTWSAGETALTAGLGALGCGLGTAVLAAAAGGPLGTHALAEFGPVWWLTGAAAGVWTAVLGVPGALLLRFWRLRVSVRTVEGADPEAAATATADQPLLGPVTAPAAPSPASARTRAARKPGGPSAPRGRALLLGEDADEEDDSEPYDFLPTDPWHERTARRTSDTGPSEKS
ncbi:DUF6350 family protein [Streptomyces sp. NPDC014734]|uniref:cell division protein PerM n=1 Tax=Streptomyces sp. NPDC014734 TaxID=3364886 RepID=UPI0036FFDB7A